MLKGVQLVTTLLERETRANQEISSAIEVYLNPLGHQNPKNCRPGTIGSTASNGQGSYAGAEHQTNNGHHLSQVADASLTAAVASNGDDRRGRHCQLLSREDFFDIFANLQELRDVQECLVKRLKVAVEQYAATVQPYLTTAGGGRATTSSTALGLRQGSMTVAELQHQQQAHHQHQHHQRTVSASGVSAPLAPEALLMKAIVEIFTAAPAPCSTSTSGGGPGISPKATTGLQAASRATAPTAEAPPSAELHSMEEFVAQHMMYSSHYNRKAAPFLRSLQQGLVSLSGSSASRRGTSGKGLFSSKGKKSGGGKGSSESTNGNGIPSVSLTAWNKDKTVTERLLAFGDFLADAAERVSLSDTLLPENDPLSCNPEAPTRHPVEILMVLLGSPLPSLLRYIHTARCLLEIPGCLSSRLTVGNRPARSLLQDFVAQASQRHFEEALWAVEWNAVADTEEIMSRMYDFSAATRDRALIHFGHVVKKFRRGRHERLMFLFSDLLCYAEEEQSKTTRDGKPRLRVRGSIPLDTQPPPQVIDVPDSYFMQLQNCFEVKLSTGGDKRYVFFAASHIEKQMWIDEITWRISRTQSTIGCPITELPVANQRIVRRCGPNSRLALQRHEDRKQLRRAAGCSGVAGPVRGISMVTIPTGDELFHHEGGEAKHVRSISNISLDFGETVNSVVCSPPSPIRDAPPAATVADIGMTRVPSTTTAAESIGAIRAPVKSLSSRTASMTGPIHLPSASSAVPAVTAEGGAEGGVKPAHHVRVSSATYSSSATHATTTTGAEPSPAAVASHHQRSSSYVDPFSMPLMQTASSSVGAAAGTVVAPQRLTPPPPTGNLNLLRPTTSELSLQATATTATFESTARNTEELCLVPSAGDTLAVSYGSPQSVEASGSPATAGGGVGRFAQQSPEGTGASPLLAEKPPAVSLLGQATVAAGDGTASAEYVTPIAVSGGTHSGGASFATAATTTEGGSGTSTPSKQTPPPYSGGTDSITNISFPVSSISGSMATPAGMMTGEGQSVNSSFVPTQVQTTHQQQADTCVSSPPPSAAAGSGTATTLPATTKKGEDVLDSLFQ